VGIAAYLSVIYLFVQVCAFVWGFESLWSDSFVLLLFSELQLGLCHSENFLRQFSKRAQKSQLNKIG
jgi:hypothetical protein